MTVSKQAAAKAAQGYTKKAPCCVRCAYFTCETERIRFSAHSSRSYTIDRNLRCTLGAFKVIKTAWCKEYEEKL